MAPNGYRQNGHISQIITPPTDQKLEIRNGLSLILELIWLNILLVPCILHDLYRKVFPPPGKSLKGQVVLVTGAGRGLGRGLALGFAREGCKVAVADVNQESAKETAEDIVRAGGTAKAYFTNVAKVEEVKALREGISRDLGEVDILVNNAGVLYGDPLEESSEELIRGVIAINLTSHFWMAREFLPAMKKRNSGHIVAIASASAFLGVANISAYAATKFGLRGFMEALRAELEARPNNKIKTSTVYPYFINTSAHYMDHWDLRIPAITIEEAVEATIAGVKRDEVSITIPSYFYTALHLARLLPQYILDQYSKVLYTRVIPLTSEEKTTNPNTVLVTNTAQETK